MKRITGMVKIIYFFLLRNVKWARKGEIIAFKMASMCDEMSVIYEDGVENGLESVVERLAEERDRITSDLQKWFVNHYNL